GGAPPPDGFVAHGTCWYSVSRASWIGSFSSAAPTTISGRPAGTSTCGVAVGVASTDADASAVGVSASLLSPPLPPHAAIASGVTDSTTSEMTARIRRCIGVEYRGEARLRLRHPMSRCGAAARVRSSHVAASQMKHHTNEAPHTPLCRRDGYRTIRLS